MVVVTRGVLRVEVQFEIAKMVGFRGFFASSHIEVSLVLLVGETGKAQNASGVSGGGIAAEFAGHGVQ